MNHIEIRTNIDTISSNLLWKYSIYINTGINAGRGGLTFNRGVPLNMQVMGGGSVMGRVMWVMGWWMCKLVLCGYNFIYYLRVDEKWKYILSTYCYGWPCNPVAAVTFYREMCFVCRFGPPTYHIWKGSLHITSGHKKDQMTEQNHHQQETLPLNSCSLTVHTDQQYPQSSASYKASSQTSTSSTNALGIR